jgi:NAD(P)-dependent dehydrogenase (short-subunit alcohol dehydrogenase family)
MPAKEECLMARQSRSLNGQVAAVTGGARGIGLATARALSRQGVKVAIGDLDAGLAKREAESLGAGAIGLPLDVTDRRSFERFLDEAEQALGPLDILVNNAGVMHMERFLDEDDAAAVRQVDINLHGVILGSKLGLARFVSRRRGHLVNIASSAGKFGIAGIATYSATKHAVVGLTEALRAELRGSGVELSVVMPGIVNTELTDGVSDTRGVKRIQPEDVADAIVEALQTSRFDVFVPKAIGSLWKGMAVLPRRFNEGLGRALKSDRVMLDFDRQRRAGYELRARRSEPGLEAADAPAELPEHAEAG